MEKNLSNTKTKNLSIKEIKKEKDIYSGDPSDDSYSTGVMGFCFILFVIVIVVVTAFAQ